MSVSTEAISFPSAIGLSDPRAVRWGNDLVTSLRRLQSVVQQRSTQSDLGALATAIAAAQTDLLALQEAIAGIDVEAIADQQAFIANIVGQVDEIFGELSRFNESAFDWTQKAAVGGINALVKGHINDGRGRTQIINEQLVRQTETTALAQSVVAVNAEIANTNSSLAVTNANVTAVQSAYATADTALAASITAVSTTVAGNTASITSLASSVDGIEARWGIAVNVQGQVIGVVQLDGSASGSTFSVVADKMQVAQPGVSGGDVVPVFVISTVGGTAKIAMRGDMIADGVITAAKISVSSMSAITANIGTATAGLIRDSSGTYEFRVPDGWIGRADGSSYIDFKNNILQFTTA